MPAGLGSVVKDLAERGVKTGAKAVVKDAAQSGVKEVSEETAKKLTEASVKSGVKASVKTGTEGVVEEGVKQGGKKGFFGTMMMGVAEKHPGLAAVGVMAAPFAVPAYLSVGWNHFFKGKSTMEAVSDEIIYDGAYRKVVEGTGEVLDFAGNTAKGTVEGAKDVLAYAGGVVRGGVEGTRDMAETIQEGLTSMVDRHYAPTPEQQEMARQAQIQQAQLYQAALQQGYYPQGYPHGAGYPMMPQQQQGGGGLLGGIGTSLSNLLNGFTGGGSNNMALAGLLAGAYLLFGGLGGGILTKVIGGAMGGYAFRSIAKGNQQQQVPVMAPVNPGVYQDRMQQNFEQQYQYAQERQRRQDDGVTVNRGGGGMVI